MKASNDSSSMNGERPHFVWLQTTIGPQPRKWASLDYGERDRLKAFVAASHPLSGEESGLSVDELSRRYPLRGEKS